VVEVFRQVDEGRTEILACLLSHSTEEPPFPPLVTLEILSQIAVIWGKGVNGGSNCGSLYTAAAVGVAVAATTIAITAFDSRRTQPGKDSVTCEGAQAQPPPEKRTVQ